MRKSGSVGSDFEWSRFKIVIPTRDSARWVGQFLAAYRAIGVEPLYIVDSRSNDRTEAILREAAADVRLFQPNADFAEAGMIAFASHMVEEDWIFRIDDDEFPSLALLRWVQESGCRSHLKAWNLSRRELLSENGQIVYSRLQLAWDPAYINAQTRLYRHREVAYCEEIHTPGFKTEESGFAPLGAYFIHCDILLRNANERLEKIRRYERDCPGSSWKYVCTYIPELLAHNEHPTVAVGTNEFDGLILSFPVSQTAPELSFTPDEVPIVDRAVKTFKRELAIGLRRAKILEDDRTSKVTAWSLLALADLIRPIEAYFTGGSRIMDRFHQLGTDIWYCANLKRSRDQLGSRQHGSFKHLLDPVHDWIHHGLKLQSLKQANPSGGSLEAGR